MPTVTIDDRTAEVPAGTNVIEAAQKVGVQIPHYCYHPRLSVVGQCRMCLVKIEGMPKLQTACSTQVMKDGMVVRTDTPEVAESVAGIMEFLLINHPLDCPICDQAGECGLQDYSFKHGQAFSRFQFEDKRTYPGRERIPLGANVMLNMNRCIQCTRCVRFTQEIAGTGEIGFFNRGARTEIGTFPGKELANELATCVVDICPVGALTSTRFRFAERVFYLDKKPSLCTGCEVGCNVTVEHRRGDIKRYKPRYNPAVNDYWMCDFGRASFERYKTLPRLTAPRRRDRSTGDASFLGWKDALDALEARVRADPEARKDQMASEAAVLGSAFLSCEEAFLLSRLADLAGAHRLGVPVDQGPRRTIPNLQGGVSGVEAGPNRRGAEMAGLAADRRSVMTADDVLTGDAAERCAFLIVADGDFGAAAHDPATVERLRRAGFLVVMGWADSPLAQAADLALPFAHHAEKDGTFVNVQGRLQRFQRAFPPPGQVRPGVEVLGDLLKRLEPGWDGLGGSAAATFARLAAAVPAFAGLAYGSLPAEGIEVGEAHGVLPDTGPLDLAAEQISG